VLAHPTEKTIEAVSFEYSKNEWKFFDDAIKADFDYLKTVQDGEIIYSRGYGMANLDYDVAIRPDSVFHIASISKQFAAFSIALLVTGLLMIGTKESARFNATMVGVKRLTAATVASNCSSSACFARSATS
jgi:hypothetical protein